jgi:hypothetical protein
VKAGLLELLFDVDLAFLNKRKKVAAHPGDLSAREAVLGEVDGLAGEMRRGGVTVGGSGVAVDAHEMLLELYSADGGVDLQRSVEAGVVSAGEISKKTSGPGAAEAAIRREAIVDLHRAIDGEGDEQSLAAHVAEIFVVLDAVEAVTVGDCVLAEKNFAGALERRRNDEAAALVIERGEDDWSGSLCFRAVQLGPGYRGPDDADDGDGLRRGRSSAASGTRTASGDVGFGVNGGFWCGGFCL